MLCVWEVQPDAVRNSVSLIIVMWVQCDKCEHLMFCTDVRVVRTGSEFLCVHLSECCIFNCIVAIL
jgi:hypothetical protein